MTDERDLRDPALDAAWRAHVRDEPPQALDQRVLAAAHRAVQSGPRAVGATPSRWRAWAPLAVAATLGVIAFGVVQLMPSHEADNSNTVMSDVPVASLRKDAAPAPAAPPANIDQPRPAEREAAPAAAPPATPAPKPQRDRASQSAPSVLAQRASPPPPPALDRTEAADRVASQSGALEERKERAASEPQTFSAAPRSKVAANAAAEQAAAPAAAPPAPAAPLARAQSTPAKVATTRTPEDFVHDIERLRAEGRDADAALALSAFRAAYADADARLPASLREWARSVPRP